MNERRGHWYLLTGIILGLAIGLLTAWVFAPVPPQAASPASLRADFKDEYRYMIAAAYAATNNLGRAQARLALLQDENIIGALTAQSERMRANNIAPNVVRNITDLSLALQADAPPTETAIPASPTTPPQEQPSAIATDETISTEAFTPLPDTATPQLNTEVPTVDSAPTFEMSPTPSPTFTTQPTPIPTIIPRATIAPTFTPGPPFSITKQTPFCEPGQAGLLQITLKDTNNQPVPGVELIVTWAGGEEHFFSGLKPELGNGYADFKMSPDIEYNLSLSNGATRVTGLKSTACAAKDGSNTFGGIRLDFKQP